MVRHAPMPASARRRHDNRGMQDTDTAPAPPHDAGWAWRNRFAALGEAF